MAWNELASDSSVEKTAQALRKRNIEVFVVGTKEEAKAKALELMPEGSEVMHVTSVTLEQTGIANAIDSGNYKSLKKMIQSVTDDGARHELRRKSSIPEFAIGSVHAVTEEGEVVIASGSGSQLAIYVFGATNLIWVVSTKKIVKNLDAAMKRIYEYTLPLESARLNAAYNITTGSSVSKILIVNKERPGRIKLIFVKEELGF
jgi:L-lactate utilization protein LutC